jgi:TetR/AcrR family transcriptional regulator, transcriptional repressor for nem operon
MAKSLKKNSLTSRAAPPTAAATAILDAAERLAQTRGYNGFSYADIAAQLGVTKASLHYHFPSKAELGRALIERYRVLFGAALDAIDQQTKEPHEKLKQYVGLYNSVLSNERMCLCGMLAAEYATLPAPMQQGLTLFFDANERWLTTVLEDGLRAGVFLFMEPANERARVLLGALEGAMLVARSYGNPHRFQMAAAYVLADLRAPGHSKQRRTSGSAAARRPRRR